MTTLKWNTVGCYVSCQFNLQGTKADTYRFAARPYPCIKNTNTHLCWLHFRQVYPCTLFQLFSPTMVPPDPAGANDRAGLVKEGHLPCLASLPMPLLRGRGVGWFDVVEREVASGWQPLCRRALCFSYPHWAPLIQVPKRSRCLATGASASAN